MFAFVPSFRQRAAILWDAFVVAAATAAAYYVPLSLLPGFVGAEEARWAAGALTVVFGADAAVWAVRAARGRRRAAWRGVALDVLAALPVYLVLGPSWLLFLRLLKLHRVAGRMREAQRHHVGMGTRLRLGFFVYWLSLAIHLIACGFIALGGVIEPTASARYVDALYWCVTTLTTVGYGDVLPRTQVQKVYAIGVMLLGVGVYAYLIGNIASLIGNLDPLRASYVQQRERLGAFMHYRGLPRPLRLRVQRYFDYLWEQRMVDDDAALPSALPPSLRDEVALYLKRDLILNVPLFRDADAGFIREIALRMRPFVCLPGDDIVRAGEPGREMYFLSRGTVEAVDASGAVLSTLHDGDFFGEIALVADTPRTATVRAVTPSDLYVLDKAMFDRTLAVYPEIAARLRARAAERRAGDEDTAL